MTDCRTLEVMPDGVLGSLFSSSVPWNQPCLGTIPCAILE